MGKIGGVNKSALWRAWKEVRRQLSKSVMRDVSDFVEYDIDPDWWINKLLKEVESGRYEPSQPFRFTVAKGLGFSRRITFPQVPDIVLYRAITGYIYQRAKRKEKGNVYFAREELARRTSNDDRLGQYEINGDEAEYGPTTSKSFEKWKEFDQYRKRLLLDRIYPYIVITDISNFFDSIIYDRVIDIIYETRVDRNTVGLLLFILEKLSFRKSFSESPRIGLPVEIFGGSRTLAHMVLFPHDREMISIVEEKAYVRWMDDQNVGVSSYAEGLSVLKSNSASLAKLHLTPNAGKTKILTYTQAYRHFHLDVNAELDELESLTHTVRYNRRMIRREVLSAWRKAKKYEKFGGEWRKVLQRFYRFAGIGRARFLRRRAFSDILREPTIAQRISDYMRVTGDAHSYIKFVSRLWEEPKQVYPDVNRILAEGLLKLEADGDDARECKGIASRLLAGRYNFPGWENCAAIAPLIILRFGDRRSLPLFRRLLSSGPEKVNPAIIKAAAVVYSSYGVKEHRKVVKSSSQLRTNFLSTFLRMLDDALKYREVPERFKIRRAPVFDSVSGSFVIDMRKILAIRLLRLNSRSRVRNWLDETRRWILNQKISDFDKNLVNKLLK